MIDDLNEYFVKAMQHCFALGGQKSPAISCGISQAYFHELYQGKKKGSERIRRIIAEVAGYSYEDFFEIGRAIVENRPIPEPEASTLTDAELENRSFITVPFSTQMKLAAGGGGRIKVDYEENISPVIVHGPTLGIKSAKNLQAFRVGGDSMEPLIAENGIVLVDKTHNRLNEIKEGAIYVLCWEDDNECAVKRLRWADKDKLLAIESANSSYSIIYKHPKEIHQLIGKVIWAWREFE